jgi:hypothetical protein
MTSSESPFFGVPQQIVDLSGSLTDFVEKTLGIRPDFSPDTLSIVDHYAVQARKEMENRPEVADLTAQALGAYFGEVVRRSEGAFWQIPSPNFHDWRLCATTAYLSLNPIGVGYDALYGRTDHQGPNSSLKIAPEDKETVQNRLERLPPVPDDEYYTLCTRLEALQIAMEAVRAEQSRRGYEDMEFTADDYSGELRPLGDY